MENICEWKNCKDLGKFKAPTERDNSRDFKWLCEKHIKLFNSKWNYFDGMSQDEIENFLKSDLTWHRPTQKFSSSDNFFSILWNKTLNDKFKVFKKNRAQYANKRNQFEKDKDAFRLLNLDFSADWATIQKRFKTLVKKLHPDRNSGNKELEDKLKK